MILAVLRRLRLMVVTLAAISVLSFLIIQAPPGNYLDTYVTQLRMKENLTGFRSRRIDQAHRLVYAVRRPASPSSPAATPAIDDARIEALEARYGLKRPLHVQYLKWIWGVLRGDLGRSMAHNMEVNELLAQRLPASLAISTISLFLVYLIGLPIGIYSATRQYSPGDYLFTFIGFMGLAIPNFLFALILLWLTFAATGNAAIGLFAAEYANAPWSFAKLIDLLKHLWMPALIVGTAGTAGLIRVVRASLLDELHKLYVTVARAKGVAERKLLFRYPVRIALNPVISTIGWTLPALVSGELLVSLVMGLPTVSPLFVTALLNQDMFLAGSVVMVLSSLTVLGTLISDILLIAIDPRIREAV